MAETTNNLRTTTISLDEYNALKVEADRLKALNGGQSATIELLNSKVRELNEKQPQVKVTHGKLEVYHNEYDGDSSHYENFRPTKIEFVNLTEVERLAENKANEENKNKVGELQEEVSILKDTINKMDNRYDELAESFNKKGRTIKKMELEHKEALDELRDEQSKRIHNLRKAYDTDVKEYNDTIKELKEEIKKVKDSKTDAEIEEKRNKEIKDLKGRIKDLEKTIEELGSMNFFKRVFKLRSISAEKLAVQTELLEREKNANNVGTTWVKEGGKYRKYDWFKDAYNYMHSFVHNGITWTFSSPW